MATTHWSMRHEQTYNIAHFKKGLFFKLNFLQCSAELCWHFIDCRFGH